MPVNKLNITYQEARAILEAIIKHAGQDGGAPVAVAVVDVSARLIAFGAMDDVIPVSIKLSQNKAYSAVLGQRDTLNWANFPKNEKTVDFDMRNWTDENFSGFTGGIIIPKDGKVIGGIGVSGRKGIRSTDDKTAQDNELAMLGLTILNF